MGVRSGWMMGWMEGFRQTSRHAGASPKLVGKAATSRRGERKNTATERKGREKPCLQTWQGFLSFVCLALGFSASGNQEMSGHGGGWGRALPQRRKTTTPSRTRTDRKTTFKQHRIWTTLVLKGRERSKTNKQFCFLYSTFYSPCKALELWNQTKFLRHGMR